MKIPVIAIYATILAVLVFPDDWLRAAVFATVLIFLKFAKP